MSTSYLTGDFKKCVLDFYYINSYNVQASVPIISVYISKIFQSLLRLSYSYQTKYRVLIYNPLSRDNSLYFSNNNLFTALRASDGTKGTYLKITNYVELQKSLDSLESVIFYLENNFPNNELTTLSGLYDRINYFVNMFGKNFDDTTPGYAKIGCESTEKTLFKFTYDKNNTSLSILVNA